MRLQPVRFVGHRIGPFEHIDLKWDPRSTNTIILGENGTGKSTLITAMSACLAFDKELTKALDLFFWGEESYCWFEIYSENECAGTIMCPISNIGDEDYLAKANAILIKDRANFKAWGTSSIDNPQGHTHAYNQKMLNLISQWQMGLETSSIAASYGVWRNLLDVPIMSFQHLEKAPMESALNPFAQTNSQYILQWIANHFIRHALAFTRNQQKEAESYQRMIRRAEAFLSQGLQYPVTFQLDSNPVSLKVKQEQVEIQISQLSDGVRSYLSWTLDYLMRAARVSWKDPVDAGVAPGLILVDEIDAHLHPEWQRRVMSSVMELLPETHIIATTHSPFVVGSADNTQLFRIKKDDNGKLTVESSFDKYHGYSADLVLLNEFVDSLYPPVIEKKMKRLSELEGKITFHKATDAEQREYDNLLEELSEVNPWLRTLLNSRKQHG